MPEKNSVWFLKDEIGRDGCSNPSPQQILWFKAMDGVKRWADIPMIHRPSLFDHSRRVMHLGIYLAQIVQGLGQDDRNPDLFKVARLARHHDDEEVLEGDKPTPTKLAMTKEQKDIFEEGNRQARSAMGNFLLMLPLHELRIYQQDREEMVARESLEAQIVEVADKLDAYGEILHEIRCGNDRFLEFLPLRNSIIEGLDRLDFWEEIKDFPSLNLELLPSSEQVEKLPRISLADFKERTDLIQLLLNHGMPQWPRFYSTWIAIQWLKLQDKDIERMILPGWREDLWKRWGIPAGTKTTPSGIRLPITF